MSKPRASGQEARMEVLFGSFTKAGVRERERERERESGSESEVNRCKARELKMEASKQEV